MADDTGDVWLALTTPTRDPTPRFLQLFVFKRNPTVDKRVFSFDFVDFSTVDLIATSDPRQATPKCD